MRGWVEDRGAGASAVPMVHGSGAVARNAGRVFVAGTLALFACSSTPAAIGGKTTVADTSGGAHAASPAGDGGDTSATRTGGGSPTPSAGASGVAADGGANGPTAGNRVPDDGPSSAGVVAASGSPTAGARATDGSSAGAVAANGGAPGAKPPDAGAPAFHASYFLGADVSDQETQPPATRANLLKTLAAHGFNAIRLRTFVDPRAADGYDQSNGSCDLAATIDFAKQIKAAGFGLLLDFHYSDNWADPGKQCVPIAWQKYTTIDALASALHDYTHDAIAQLVASSARPDLVQIGNEITPGMLLHRCDSSGQPSGDNPITGSTKDWSKLGALLAAGAQGVKDIDATIKLALHIDRCGDKPSERAGAALDASASWVENARKYVSFDALGESCYQRYQGDPASAPNTQAGWTRTLSGLAQRFPDLTLFAAEYGPMQREINDVVFGLPDQRGIGTFNWEPTTQGDWNTGHDLLRRSGDTYAATADLMLYDAMARDYASRL